jgi:hypothetical protein
MTTPRSDIYQAELEPLLAAISHLCEVHDIPFIASFQLNEGDRPLEGVHHFCTSAYLPSDSTPKFWLIYQALEVPREAARIVTAQ